MKKKEEEFTPRDPHAFDTACRLFAGGASKSQIAEHLKMPPSTVGNWSKQDEWRRQVAAYQRDMPQVAQPKKIRKIKEWNLACELEATGDLTPDQLAAAVGVSVATIKDWRKEPDWQAAVAQFQPEAGDRTINDITEITLQFLSTLKMRDLKNFCVALKRNIGYQQAIQAAEIERARSDLGMLQKLEDFCGNKDFSAIQLREAWSARLKPPDDKDDKLD